MQDNNNQNGRPKRRHDILLYVLIAVLIIGFYFLIQRLMRPATKVLTYNEFTSAVEADTITSSSLVAYPVGGENEGMFKITGQYKIGDQTYQFSVTLTTTEIEALRNNDKLKDKLYLGTLSSFNIWNVILTYLPFILLIGLIVYSMKNMGGGNNKAFDFGKSTARLLRDKTVTFNDVAGCDEEKQELVELVDFLKNPAKYTEIGAKIPRGVLLFGPPGTGKTLLAKAVAGEANVPFFSISGSDFVEMFVGVGASRVRDLFKTAKQNAPCIIFIDEIDAVGRQRGAGMGGGHDEREQTLNQLLVEMDGFVPNSGIIVMAATNRPDVLDPALLRPGRFDRQITISNPDVNGREAILKIHARNKNLDKNIHLNEIAQRIPGFSGADIANLLNEAALLAARANRKVITLADIDEATDRVMMGPAKKSRKITERERKCVAFHEAGHSVIGLKLDNASIVQKVTIIPRGQAGGYNLMMPAEETYLETKHSLTDRITGYLGGRVAEEIVFNEVSTGASNDFQNATKIARAMVTEYGMSDLGPVQYEQPQGSVFLGRDYLKEKNFSDQIALEIDKESRRIIEECYEVARKIINENRPLLDAIANYLLEIETLTKQDIDEINATGKLKWYDEKKAKQEAIKNGDVVPEEKKELDEKASNLVDQINKSNGELPH